MDKARIEEIIKLYSKKPSYKNLIRKQDTAFVEQLKSCTCDAVLFSNTRLIEIQKLVRANYEAPSFTEDILKAYSAVQKQIPKQYKYQRQLNVMLNAKKISTCCMQHLRRGLSRTSKTNPYLKSKRVGKELNVYFKKTKRHVDKKELEEKEAIRQKKKLNFLINQTEIFGHFMMKKGKINLEEGVGTEAAKKQLDWINEFDKKDEDGVHAHKKTKKEGLEHEGTINTQGDTFEKSKTTCEDTSKTREETNTTNEDVANKNENTETYVQKPEILNATLKGYQLQGLRWLVNLYDQGINGILADDMGLGKTVQSISFLAHLKEKEKIDGPFLIITPASTLHNWINEFEKFLPSFKVVSYWGGVNERKLMRKQFSSSNVVVTSYQMVVTDEKLFKRIKWHYMILDEAQAIKSSTSLRWKTLLSIACRNRLLLTGTPIQNTMGELWALLHFIMPTLFDSHDEFSTWFSKDIEKEGKNIDDVQLQRLHMILKPFMLRRVKDDVKDELGIKTEKDIYCEMSIRQKKLYRLIGEQRNIDMEELTDAIKKVDICEGKTGGDDMLLNLIMQYRKVCNHPDLFEREEVRSGYCFEVNDHLNSEYITEMHRSLLNFTVPKIVGDFIVENNTNKLNTCYNALRSDLTHQIDNRKTYIETKDNSKRLKLDEKDRTITDCSNICDAIKNIQDNKISLYKNIIDKMVGTLEQENPYHIFERQDERCIVEEQIEVTKEMRVRSKGKYYIHSVSQSVENNKLMKLVSDKIQARRTLLSQYSNMYIPPVLAAPSRLHTNSYLLAKELEKIDKNNDLPCVSNNIFIPRLDTFISDSGKLLVLDALLKKLKKGGHRVLIYFQMTKMMNLMEDYLVKRGYTYCRLDGSSRLNVRRDIVNNWQTSDEKFVFILSTRAGGLGINLTAADTVIFYDSDWNPTVDQQAMDRAHRLGQTKNVTVYRLITKNTIEERVIARAARKGEIQKMVIQGGEFSMKDFE